MNINSKVLFILGCIPARLLMAYLPQILPTNYLPFLGLLISFMAIGMLYLFFTNSRLKAMEAGGTTWWKNYRLLHGMLLLTGAIYLFRKQRIASLPLFFDVFIGTLLFLDYRKYLDIF